jgi:AI-2 transport protein TqsA
MEHKAARTRQPVPGQVRLSRPLLTLIALVIVVGGLKALAPVVLPLIFALFLLAIFWPLQRRLKERMPDGLAALCTLLILLIMVALLIGALWFSGSLIAQSWPEFQRELGYALQVVERYGIAISGSTGKNTQSGQSAAYQIEARWLLDLGETILNVGASVILVFGYLVLSLLEIDQYPDKLKRMLSAGTAQRWLQIAQEITNEFQGYMTVRTLVGLINGGLVGIATWLLGIHFAFIWGFLSLLLNYIPTLGSVVAISLTLLFALIQFDQTGQQLLAFVVLLGLRAVLGNFVDPLLQGKYLTLSPVAVLLSVAFWGWLWGITGAVIGVPLTILVIISCRQFSRTRWIATLLTNADELENKS